MAVNVKVTMKDVDGDVLKFVYTSNDLIVLDSLTGSLAFPVTQAEFGTVMQGIRTLFTLSDAAITGIEFEKA